jgi:hypothetical protein
MCLRAGGTVTFFTLHCHFFDILSIFSLINELDILVEVIHPIKLLYPLPKIKVSLVLSYNENKLVRVDQSPFSYEF